MGNVSLVNTKRLVRELFRELAQVQVALEDQGAAAAGSAAAQVVVVVLQGVGRL